MSDTVLLTGATSFTGAHIARALVEAGFNVLAPLTRELAAYDDPLIRARMEHSRVNVWVPSAPFGSDAFLAAIAQHRPSVFINHGADIKGYRQPDFDYLASLGKTLHRAREVFAALAQAGARHVIHSGSIFEPNEGSPSPGLEGSSEALSIYGVSKSMAWEAVRFFALGAKLSLSKIIIPNPVGAYENEDRLIPYFVREWEGGRDPSLRTPHLIRDNLPAPWLARVYVEECTPTPPAQLGPNGEPLLSTWRVRRPSGYAVSNQEFIELFVKRLRACRSGHCGVRLDAVATTEPLVRVNTEISPELADPAREQAFWEAWFSALVR